MVTAEDIFYRHIEGIGTKAAILQAMNEYARIKWDEACEATKSNIVTHWNPDATSEIDGLLQTPNPEFVP